MPRASVLDVRVAVAPQTPRVVRAVRVTSRAMAPRDIQQCLAIELSNYAGHPAMLAEAFDKDEWHALLGNPNERAIVAEAGGVVVGVVIVEIPPFALSTHNHTTPAEIHFLFVDKGRQRMGIGMALLRAAVR